MDEQVPTKVCVGVPDDVLRPHSARAELRITDFGYDKRQPDGYGRYCRKCMNTFSSKRYQERAGERKKEKRRRQETQSNEAKRILLEVKEEDFLDDEQELSSSWTWNNFEEVEKEMD